MADNIEITPGTGKTIATDDITNVHFQRVKLVDGTLDSATAIAAGGGVEAGALRVTIASDSTGVISIDDGGNTITIDGTVDLGVTDSAYLLAIKTAVEILDNIVAGTEAQVDVITVPAPLNVVGTGTEATALRVTIASDSTGLISIDDNGGSITIDGTVTSNLGTTDAANLAAIKTAVEILDNAIAGTEMQVDVLTVPAPLNVVGGGTEAAALRVTIANDSTGVVTVDDGGGALTVDGTVSISGTVAVTDNAGSLTVDVGSALPAGTNNIGDVDVLSIAAGDNNIGNVDVLTLPALVAGTANIGDVDVLSIAAGETHIGEVGLADDTFIITPACSTDAYTTGDVLFNTTVITDAVRVNGDSCILQSVHIVDKDDQGLAMDLLFMSSTDTVGTVNAAVSITDANALKTLGFVSVVAGDYCDLIASQVATVTGIGLVLEAGAATRNLYVAGITRGAPTHTADGIQLTFGLLRN